MNNQISVSSELFDAFYKAKEILDNEYQEALEWITDIIENEDRPKLDRCEICYSDKKLEQHHVRGKKHGNECITVCQECHRKLTDEQRLWDMSWLDPDSENKDAFLVRGFIDVCNLKYEKTGNEIFKVFSEILVEGFSYD